MAENCLYVQNLSPTITLPVLQKLFGFYGVCNVQFAGDQALVQYQSLDSCQQAIEYLDNTNLLTANGQQNISIQLIDLAALAQQTIAMSNPQVNQNQQANLQNNNNVNGIKKSQNKDFQNERTYTMNIENKERSASPFQNNNARVQNMGQNKNLTPNIKNQQQQQGMMGNNQNYQNNMGGRSIGKMNNQKENLGTTQQILTQKLPNIGGPNFENKYFQSTNINSNPKVSTLVDLYKANKTNIPNDKVKIYSNYDEFWQDAKKMPRTRESTSPYPEMRQTQKPINYDKMTIAELTIELKKKGLVMSGTKQALKYALERFNESI